MIVVFKTFKMRQFYKQIFANYDNILSTNIKRLVYSDNQVLPFIRLEKKLFHLESSFKTNIQFQW